MHRNRTNADDVKLEPTLQQLAFNLRRDAVETDVALWEDRILVWGRRGSGAGGGHCEGEARLGVRSMVQIKILKTST